MDLEQTRALLNAVAQGSVDVETALGRLKQEPFEDLGFAKEIGRASCRERVY